MLSKLRTPKSKLLFVVLCVILWSAIAKAFVSLMFKIDDLYIAHDIAKGIDVSDKGLPIAIAYSFFLIWVGIAANAVINILLMFLLRNRYRPSAPVFFLKSASWCSRILLFLTLAPYAVWTALVFYDFIFHPIQDWVEYLDILAGYLLWSVFASNLILWRAALCGPQEQGDQTDRPA